jgi:hypothetical protein
VCFQSDDAQLRRLLCIDQLAARHQTMRALLADERRQKVCCAHAIEE